MKTTRNFSLLIFIFLCQSIFAFPWEIAFRTTDANGNASSASVTVYTFNSSTRNYDVYTGGSTAGSFDQSGYNGYADIGDSNTPGAMFSLAAGNSYYIKIGNLYMSLIWGGGSVYGDMTFNYKSGTTESLSCGYNTSGYSISGPYTWSDKNITLANDFGSDRSSCYGNIHFNSMTLTNVGYSGTTLTREAGTFPHTAAGEDNQQVNSYYRKWRNWSDSYTGISYNLATANNYNLTAIYAKQVNATISLNPNGSTITLNGNTITGSQYLYDDQPYTFAAANQVSSTWISYVFDHWIYDNTTVTSSTIIINYPTGNHSLAAYFIGTARPDPMNIHFTSANGQPISLAWTEHPNSDVTQYQVWRYRDGESPSSIATLNRGTTSFIDYAYIQNPNGVAKLFYTVKAYYSPSGTWNDPGYYLNRGDIAPMIADGGAAEKLNLVNKEIPSGYSVSNYPNPFNPTTIINYQLPQDGFVTIKVFDVLGKEIATLVSENKSAGYYNISFDASSAGGGLTSGVYIYTINANGFAQSKKMLLMK